MRRSELRFTAFLFWLLPTLASGAITLPLQGYCKPGCFFPIQVDGADCTQSITFSAGVAPASNMETQAGSRVIVPFLAGDELHELGWKTGSLPLRTAESDERLVAGLSSDEIATAAALFPGKRLLPILIDPAELLPGPLVAWESLDGIILSANLFQRITDDQRSALLAEGMMLISIGDAPPDGRWPWRRNGSLWVLSAAITGPRAELVNENIYAPTFNWTPDWPSSIREQVVGVAALVVLATIALSLRPTRASNWITAVFLSLTAAGIISWRHAITSVDSVGGDILIVANGLVQRDAYLYQRAREPGPQNVLWTGSTRPIFPSQKAMSQAKMQLRLSSTGGLVFTYDAQPGHTMAFLRRTIHPGDLPASQPPSDSLMMDLAKLEYLQKDDVFGEIPSPKGRWPSVVIRHP